MLTDHEKRRIYWWFAHRWSALKLHRRVIYLALTCIIFVTVIGVLRRPLLYVAPVTVRVDHDRTDGAGTY